MSSLPWWIVSAMWLAGKGAIWGAVLVYAIRQRVSRPKAARLVFAAVGLKALQWVLQLSNAVIASLGTFSMGFSSDGPDWSNPVLVYEVTMQLFHAACEISSWSLLAWAALMRPDEARPRR